VRAPCRVCRRDSALTRRGLVWAHAGRNAWGRPSGRCAGAGAPPLGSPGPDLPPAPGQLLAPPPWAREHPGGTVYLLHLTEPFGHARHYMGWASDLPRRLAHHQAGTGANLLRHVAKAGIGWELARTWPGDRAEERRLKARASTRRCPLCVPTLPGHLARRVH
jgi:predicted GIY-YIG superfamily endonuclease